MKPPGMRILFLRKEYTYWRDKQSEISSTNLEAWRAVRKKVLKTAAYPEKKILLLLRLIPFPNFMERFGRMAICGGHTRMLKMSLFLTPSGSYHLGSCLSVTSFFLLVLACILM